MLLDIIYMAIGKLLNASGRPIRLAVLAESVRAKPV